MFPKIREDNLIVERLPDETLIYDLKRHKAHCLNHSATVVWQHCDGQTDVEGLAKLIQNECQLPADPELVWLALERLEKAHLLQDPLARPPGMSLPSRRQLMRKLGLIGGLSLLLPAIHSVLAPNAYAAASIIANNQCDKAHPENIGKCCTNHKTCVVVNPQTGDCKCQGPAC